MSMEFRVLRLRNQESINLPAKAGPLEAGIDFFCPVTTFIRPGQTIKIPLGLAAEIPEGYFLKFFDRSSIASKGVFVVAGVIDCTYRGELAVLVYNSTYDGHTFLMGQKIVQGVLLPVPDVTISEVSALSVTDRGSGGFGSTDKPNPPSPVVFDKSNYLKDGCFGIEMLTSGSLSPYYES